MKRHLYYIDFYNDFITGKVNSKQLDSTINLVSHTNPPICQQKKAWQCDSMRRIIEENMYAILANYLLKMKIILYFIVLVTINVDYNIMLYLMLNVI